MDIKGEIDIHTDDKADVKDFKIDDEIKVEAVGKIVSLDKNDRMDMPMVAGEKGTGKKKIEYTARIDLSNIKLDNITTEDRKGAENERMDIGTYKKIKKIKDEVKAKHNIV